MKNPEKIRIYLAGDMFDEANQNYNAFLAKKIRERLGDKIDLYVPQENKSINDKTKCASSREIFKADFARLENCDILLARIDGNAIPPGTSNELGIIEYRSYMIQKLFELKDQFKAKEDWSLLKEAFFIKNTPPTIVGLGTDCRNPKLTYLEDKNKLMKEEDFESQYCYLNLFVIGGIKNYGVIAVTGKQLVDLLENVVDTFIANNEKVEDNE